ncbi:RNA polymerase sigma factor [Prevotella sp. 10(H)]|uniref:RNA polymerase sigma factor n=1 Tax=Prevotella sp. 10(H) TaxID=1158294 RepID=UPI0004A75FEE|nr:RNA polymerase sigma-70 factor [Prevotella sp. 10(H)]
MKNRSEKDYDLINAISNGDYLSYNQLFMYYYNPLCRYAFSIIKSKTDAEDIVQELFLNIWNNRKRLEIYTNVSSYLYSAIRNMTLNYIRDNNKNKIPLENIQDIENTSEEQFLEQEEFRKALNDCIKELPQRCREVLILQRVKGLRQKEISEKLNISIKTIKNQIWISMQRIKICIGLKGF